MALLGTTWAPLPQVRFCGSYREGAGWRIRQPGLVCQALTGVVKHSDGLVLRSSPADGIRNAITNHNKEQLCVTHICSYSAFFCFSTVLNRLLGRKRLFCPFLLHTYTALSPQVDPAVRSPLHSCPVQPPSPNAWAAGRGTPWTPGRHRAVFDQSFILGWGR